MATLQEAPEALGNVKRGRIIPFLELTRHALLPLLQTLVQACLYPLGRSDEVFQDPKRFDPGRWGSRAEGGGASTQGGGGGTAFRSLAFGFGARQCVGRRIAENEMQLVLMHVREGRERGGGGGGGSIWCLT